MQERRRRRSEEKPVALRYYLDHMAEMRGHQAVVLADRDGLLIAQSESRIDPEALAALAPLQAQRKDCAAQLGLKGFQVWPLEIENAVSYLATVGGDSSTPNQAARDINRILGHL